jgi:hypothetical protein
MKKFGWGMVGLAVLATLAFLWMMKAPILSQALSSNLRIGISVGTISVWPSETEMRWVKVKNPWGFKKNSACKVAKIHVLYRWDQLKGQPSVIDLIELDGVKVNIEFSNANGTSSNWSKILSQMPKMKKAKEVLVTKLIVRNFSVEISGLKGSKTIVKNVDYMEFDDIDSKEGFPTRELISEIFGQAELMQFIEEILPIGPKGWLEKLTPF